LPRLRAGGNFQLRFSLNRGDFDLCSERRIGTVT
jgi:hypothetical protein